MTKKLYLPLILLLVFSMVMTACAQVVAPAAVVEQPAVVPATAAPTMAVSPTKEALAAVDWTGVWTDFTTNMPAGYYTIKGDVLNAQITAGNAPFIIDVREPAEIEKAGYIKGAINLPLRSLLQNLDKLPALDKPIAVYCAIGHRGAMAMVALRLLGYDALSIGGGFNAWAAANLPVEKGKPADPVAGTAAKVDPARLADLNTYLTGLPANFDGITNTDALAALGSATPPVLIDVRTDGEIKTNGYIKGSIFIPVNDLLKDATKLPADKATPIITVCSAGHRGAVATMALRMLGYKNVKSIFGGTGGWAAAKLPLEGVVSWTNVWTDFLKNMPADFYTIKSDVLNAQITAGNAPFIIDVREPAEIEKAGYIKGAVNLPLRSLLQNLDKLPALDKPIAVYCAIGHRGAMAMSALRLLGYDARSIGGGFNAWAAAKLPVEKGKPADPVAGTAAKVDPQRLKGLNDYLANLPANFDGMADTDLLKALGSATPPTVIDVRTAAEVKTSGYI